MPFRIGDKAPDFTADTTQGSLSLHQYLGDSWGLLFSHPKDFTPVCTTELGSLAELEPEFTKRGVKLIGLSVDPVADHARWLPDIKDVTGFLPNYPLVGDPDLKVAKLYDMLPADAGDTATGRTAANNATVRVVYIIGPDKGIKALLAYPMTSGRNFTEVLRLIDSLQAGAGPVPEALHEVLEFAVLASHRRAFDPMESAIVDAGQHLLAETEHLHADWTLVEDYPLSSEMMAISSDSRRQPRKASAAQSVLLPEPGGAGRIRARPSRSSTAAWIISQWFTWAVMHQFNAH